MKKSDSQHAWVRNQLKAGKPITPLDALRGCNCFRLASIVHRLRVNEGMDILTSTQQTADGRPYAVYRLNKQQLQEQQKEAA